MINLELEGRCAIVTGASNGIGKIIAQRLVASGAKVSGWDISPPKDDVLDDVQTFDISDEAEVKKAMANVEEAFGRVDILVNAAGIIGPSGPVVDYEVSDWNQIMSINLTGVFLTCRAVVPEMRKQSYGRIVNIASVAAKDGNLNLAAYSASKAGVVGLTKSLAREEAENGVLVNCITPGLIATDMIKSLSEENLAWSRSRIPMGRIGQPEEVAAMVGWLCSEECSFSTGAVFDISGGRSTY